MNPIERFHELSEQLAKINEYRASHLDAFVAGSFCQRAYEDIIKELDEIIPQANALIKKCEDIVQKFS